MLSVAENLAAVRSRVDEACRRAGRSPDEVTLIAVSKRQPDDRLQAAYDAGQRDFGENYVQELVRKRALLPADARWHLIGHLQTNKAKMAVGAFLIHTVDSSRVAQALQKAAEGAGVTPSVLVEVNLAAEPSKAGLPPEEVAALIAEQPQWSALRLAGLMCIPPVEAGRRYFAALRALRDELQAQTGVRLAELSMGMSGDFEDAIAEGATLIRVGTAIFGPRG